MIFELWFFNIDISEECMQMACLSLDTNKHLLHALFAIQRRSWNRKKKDLSDLLSKLKKKCGRKEDLSRDWRRKKNMQRKVRGRTHSLGGNNWTMAAGEDEDEGKGLGGDNKDGTWRGVVTVRDFTVQVSLGFLTYAMHVVHLLPDFSLIQTAWTSKKKTRWAA